MWTAEQWERIFFETNLVSRYLPDFRWFNWPPASGFLGWVRPGTGTVSYQLRLDVGPHYPYVAPDLQVTSPPVLWMYGGRQTINSLGVSHNYHVYGNDPNSGCLRICHTAGWDASANCIQVLLRGIIWVESYSIHLRTGATIATIIDSFAEYHRLWAQPLILV
jgi:hypothetical protein